MGNPRGGTSGVVHVRSVFWKFSPWSVLRGFGLGLKDLWMHWQFDGWVIIQFLMYRVLWYPTWTNSFDSMTNYGLYSSPVERASLTVECISRLSYCLRWVNKVGNEGSCVCYSLTSKLLMHISLCAIVHTIFPCLPGPPLSSFFWSLPFLANMRHVSYHWFSFKRSQFR